jgi:hypothetical protein
VRGRLNNERGQAPRTVFGVQTYRIAVIVIGRQYGILAGTNRVMSRVVAAAATQVGKDAMAFAAVPRTCVGTAERLSCADDRRQEQTHKNGVNNHFGNGSHILAAL